MREIPSTAQDRIGKKFGRLTVIGFAYYKPRKNGNSRDAFWQCKCDCGNEKEVMNSNLLSGNVSSCGCVREESLKKLHEANIDDSATFRAVLKTYKWSAKQRGISFKLTEEKFKELTQGNCEYCGTQPSFIKERNGRTAYKGKPYVYNGIDRVDNDKGYVSDNCVPCCRICNIAKGEMTVKEFLDWIKKVYENRPKN
jgi:hypothetical protein